MNKLKLVLTIALLSSVAVAEKLLFPVEKNNVQVFPQRFEYSLLDNNRFRLGDISIDSSEIDLQLKNNPEAPEENFFSFKWPADLIKTGEILIQDNSGKTLWATKVSSKDIKVSSPRQKLSDDTAPGRASNATFRSAQISHEFIDSLQLNPFFRFCVRKEEQETRIYICSRDLYLKKTKTSYSILTRESSRKASVVEINGRPVDPQGIVYLNEVTDNISLLALMENGTRLEIDTRRKDVVFEDVVQANKGQGLIIRARGTEPVNSAQVTRKGSGSWETTVELERPTIYLKGEGNIPMRQEFLANGKIRTDAIQVEVISGSQPITYDSELELVLKPAKGLSLSVGDKNSALAQNNTWNLNGLEKGTLNRRYLNVSSPEGKFVAAYETYRGYQFEMHTRLMLPLFSQTQLSWWLGSRWGLDVNYDKILAKGADEADWSSLKLDLLFRFTPGIQLKSPSSGLLLFYNQLSSSSSASLLGVGAFSDLTSPWAGPVHVFHGRFNLPIAKMGTDMALKTSWDIELAARHFSSETLFYELGFRLMKYNLANETAEIKYSKTLIFGGLGLVF